MGVMPAGTMVEAKFTSWTGERGSGADNQDNVELYHWIRSCVCVYNEEHVGSGGSLHWELVRRKGREFRPFLTSCGVLTDQVALFGHQFIPSFVPSLGLG